MGWMIPSDPNAFWRFYSRRIHFITFPGFTNPKATCQSTPSSIWWFNKAALRFSLTFRWLITPPDKM
jgi:hypothetical protein